MSKLFYGALACFLIGFSATVIVYNILEIIGAIT